MIMANELQKLDYEIINFVYQKGTVLETELYTKIHADEDSIKLRVELLSRPDYYSNRIPIPDSSYINRLYEDEISEVGLSYPKYTGFLTITALGIKSLEDLSIKKKRESREYWLRSVVTPIAVSIITAILTTIVTLLVTKYSNILP